jgi:putative OPT family oligopeptide transporter
MSGPATPPTASEYPPPGVDPTKGGGVHQPYISDEQEIPEFTLPALLAGTVLGIIFGASSLYLVLKVGLTVSASIPVAVLSITLFRGLSRLGLLRRANILENNIVQTTGSAGESIAFGVGVTMPALMLLGFEMDIGRVMVVAVLGGLLGILMMIPLRRAFIVKQHGTLKYPEGTACADVLIVGEQGGATAQTVFVGFGLAFVYEFLRLGFKFFKDTVETRLSWFKGAVPAIEVNPALLGVGYIIGTQISCVMVAGGVLASFVLIPAIRLFGDQLLAPLYPAKVLISSMAEEDIWHEYILYIGAGAVAAGGIISLVQALPLIVSSIKAGVGDILAARGGAQGEGKRTDRDLPIWIVGVGTLVLVALIYSTSPLHERFAWVPDLKMHVTGAVLIVLFGFLFVTVSSRLTGEIGSSSNPISGMTVATLLLTCLIFVALGWTSAADRLTALSVAAVVCIAASNGGTTSQDLKTGYLVGATPRWQQLSIVVGATSSAVVIGAILIQLNLAYTIYTSRNLPSLSQPIQMVELKKAGEQAKAPGDDTPYWVWRAAEGNDQKVPPGKYLVDDKGALRYLVDPGINGKRSHRDDGTEVVRFKAPKAVLMSLITDGILRGKLPWALVLLGVAIALVLELCSVPSLAFAVGVYLPLSSSTPIFVGGLARYIADRWGPKRPGASETDSETSPGALLSTGYIAGGAIAGVLIAFLSFSDTIPNQMATWQYRTVVTPRDQTLAADARELARQELGYAGDGMLPEAQQKEVDAVASGIADLNHEVLTQFLVVPKGFGLKLPQQDRPYVVPADTHLGDLAKEKLGKVGKSHLLLSLNQDALIRVPKGAKLKLPSEKKHTVSADSSLGQVTQAIYSKDDPDQMRKLYDTNKLADTVNARYVTVPAQAVLELPRGKKYTAPKQMYLEEIAAGELDDPGRASEILELNLGQLIRVPAGTTLLVPEEKVYEVPAEMSLAEIGQQVLGSSEKARQLYELNQGDLDNPIIVPKGTELRLPQSIMPAVYAFSALTLFLIAVGLGWFFAVPSPSK